MCDTDTEPVRTRHKAEKKSPNFQVQRSRANDENEASSARTSPVTLESRTGIYLRIRAHHHEEEQLKIRLCTFSKNAGEQDKNRPRGDLHVEIREIQHELRGQERTSTVKPQTLNLTRRVPPREQWRRRPHRTCSPTCPRKKVASFTPRRPTVLHNPIRKLALCS